MLLSINTIDIIFFFFNDTATTQIYTLSLHDALPISSWPKHPQGAPTWPANSVSTVVSTMTRSEEHTYELQSNHDIVLCMLLEKKKKKQEQLQHDKKQNINNISNT